MPKTKQNLQTAPKTRDGEQCYIQNMIETIITHKDVFVSINTKKTRNQLTITQRKGKGKGKKQSICNTNYSYGP